MMTRHAFRVSGALALTALASFLLGGSDTSLAAQAVSVSPTAIFLDHAERSGRLTQVNEGDFPA